MRGEISRRRLLKGLVAGAAVIGFDPVNRLWVTAAHARGSCERLPDLDGALYTDSRSRREAADDFGHIVHRTPVAVLRPGSAEDIARMICYARAHKLQMAPRGQAHSTYGQPQVDAGIVVDMGGLNRVHSLGPGGADVDAGILWSSVLSRSLLEKLTPPVLTDYLELSVGGTLAVGGIGGTSHQHGLQVDNVEELEVVTGTGDIVVTSPSRRPDLFDAVLAGFGQCGIVTRARLGLVPAQTNARVFMLNYDNLAHFSSDQMLLIRERRFDYVEGQVLPAEGGGWYYMLEAATFYTPPSLPDNASLLAGLRYKRGSERIEDHSYLDFSHRLAPLVLVLKAMGAWDLPHPWFNVFLPASTVEQYVEEVLSTLTLADTGQGPILLYPIPTDVVAAPLFRVPDEEVVFLFDILRFAPPDDGVVRGMLADNRRLFERARELGGNQYPIGSIPFSRKDWKEHFGEEWRSLVKAKHRFDPHNILTPGQGIFLHGSGNAGRGRQVPAARASTSPDRALGSPV